MQKDINRFMETMELESGPEPGFGATGEDTPPSVGA